MSAAAKLPEWPAVVVHDRPTAEQALQLAGGRGLLLLSARGAAASLGAPWFAAMTDGLAEAAGPCAAVLDCTGAPGFVMPSLRAGLRWLVLEEDCPAFPVLGAAVAAGGGLLLPARPPALDLAPFDLTRPEAQRRLAQWLAGTR